MGRKVAVLIIIGVLLAGLVVTSAWRLGAWERASKAYNHDNLIRLHIMANSNDPGDQEVKYRVRDAIVAAFRPELLRVSSRAEAEALLAADQAKIARLAEQVVAANGRSYPARVEIGNFDFPTRAYGDLVLPAGNYRAVRVILGQGAGANWWCVLYPPLCFVDITGSGVQTSDAGNPGATLANGPGQPSWAQEETSPVAGSGSVRLRLKILDWLEAGSEYMAGLF
jgi:stage II sporulation protein R